MWNVVFFRCLPKIAGITNNHIEATTITTLRYDIAHISVVVPIIVSMLLELAVEDQMIKPT